MGTLHVVTHTHWDREWHAPFSTFRAHLLDLVLHTLDLLEQGQLDHFLFDGQLIILEDIFALRPDLLPRFQALNQADKLSVGPWYVLADQLSVSGEALLRNLLEGQQLAQQYGLKIMPLGYAPDTFGHSADLPRLLAGFGHQAALVWRGAPHAQAVFRWQSPDGSEVLAFNQGYYQPDVLWEVAGSRERLQTYIDQQAPRYPLDQWLLLNGGDHLAPRPHLKTSFAQADLPHQLQETSLLAYAELVQQRLDLSQLPVQVGELRQQEMVPFVYLLPATWSARLHLKQANAHLQHQLTHADTWLALAKNNQTNTPAHLDSLLHHAWRTLLQNHPHDTICGCSTTEVTQESIIRFKQANQTAEYVIQAAQNTLLGQMPYVKAPTETTYLVVWNPFGQAATQDVEVHLELPQGYYPDTLYTPSGEEIPFAWRESSSQEGFEWHIHHLPQWHPQQVRGKIAFIAEQVPACGYAVYELRLGQEAQPTLRWSTHLIPDTLYFMDEPDGGDTYNFSPLAEPTLLEVNSSLRYSHPEGGLKVEVLPRIWSGLPYRQYTIVVYNQLENHRLRLWLDSGQHLPHAYTDTHYGFQERTIRLGDEPHLDPQTHPNQEVPTFTHPMQSLAICDNGQHAIGLAALGLPEVEFIQQHQHTQIALTLLRSVGWLSRRDLVSRTGGAGPLYPTPDAQMLGKYTYKLAVLNLPTQNQAAWWHAVRNCVYPLSVQQVKTAPAQRSQSFISVENPALALVTVKSPEHRQGLLLRLLNLTDQAQPLQTWADWKPLRLDETLLAEMPETLAPLGLTTLYRPSAT